MSNNLTAELEGQKDLLKQINKVSKAILRDMREISQFAARGSHGTTWTHPYDPTPVDRTGPAETKDGEGC